ncbi:ParB N-terminal domain-containing protein [Clostridium sp. BJN0001]|uniref:ParB/RepB/Spo0J family partition protein n=1 Tax=Clostridium sp. BJN0001 TaxID=2930219 RepID=UPI001FD43E84|nr:ParB N-terminal domain-containing protein [Clostridium sp. BJN0001]
MSYLKGLAERINGAVEKGFTEELDINCLVPSHNNFYGIRDIEELADSIKENGLMHNLVVRKTDEDKYEIISGERRYRALLSLGFKKVPCKVKDDLSDLDAELMLIKANAEQRELTPTEKMQGIKRLEEIYIKKRSKGAKLEGKTRDLIGKDLGMSGVQVGRYKKIEKDLIPEFKDKLDKEEITLTQAHTLSSLTENEQNTIHEEIKDMNTKDNKEELETLVNGIKQPVERKQDINMINDISKAAKAVERVKKGLESSSVGPKIIISNNAIEAVCYVTDSEIDKDGVLKVKLSNFGRISTIKIKITCFEKQDKNKNKIPKDYYKIASDVYIRFIENEVMK